MNKLTAKQKAEIERLARMPDREIDTSDIPEVSFTSRAVVGRFYRPVKRAISVRLDADVLAWLKHSGPGYQSRINAILRREMLGQEKP
jgi:uncharacterized protein (DUF4415 family)